MKNINLKSASLALAAVGLLALVRATVFDTAPEGTHNIGLMQVQMLWSQFASTALVISALLFVANHTAQARAAVAPVEGR